MRIVFACAVLCLTGLASPAFAGCDNGPADCWWHAHHVIYHIENRIAYLEADPNADDGYKRRVVDKLHRKILRIRAAIGPRWPHRRSPCCYSRPHITVR